MTTTDPAHIEEKVANDDDAAYTLEVEEAKSPMPTAMTDKDCMTVPEPESEPDAGIQLSWRSWIVVFTTCFAIVAQVFVVTAAGSVIAFIVRDLGGGNAIAGWVIQGPLLMQSVLSPIVGRLSDVLDRKYLASIPPLVAFIGAVISAKATSMSMLIGGGVLIGTTLSTIAIVQAIPSEILPMKYRALANGFCYLGGAIGGISGGLVAGGVTKVRASGWRDIFWIQAGLHLATSAGLLIFYHPPGDYAWSDPHVAANLAVGLVFFAFFCLYEWKGRNDGLVAHVFFKGSPNFGLSVFGFAVEGWLFYSAVNSIIPQIILYLGFETDAFLISLRGLACSGPAAITSMLITLYSTKTKDLKWPVIFSFVFFLIGSICYAVITPQMNRAQIGFSVLIGIGLAGPLTLLIALVQFTAPHVHLSTATGLAFSARAIGGAFGSAVLDAIIQGTLSSSWAPAVSHAAVQSGLPTSSLPALLEAMQAGAGIADVPGVNASIVASAEAAGHQAYAHAYHLAWASIVPFVALGIVAVACLKGVKHLMTEKIEATVEHVRQADEEVA
ncbi:hypothetical protein T310_5017 [Rasamsonia emersonii CBS 393.64]|uniref:Major facilitator superfamily (MFS) profile domain-containing protein n=1 Tax=Rasamsonia emersonii (strain ATCC 16479 / CBS 393.64 / IMI 116815) TaxID=1408163 RepID=A0A0F4YRL4_RASE3|nr:hypothetical protein T310_5017 [Rasamsonia emersonii CBS 393.64]KKA20932.1 hypothetical protein T310_5017 [Rasamsonia emersonii CBS 393.64]